MFDQPVIIALICGLAIAIVAGIMGCFVVWRRMAYFGDSLAHSSLLGVVLGLVFGFSDNLGIIIACTIFAILMVWLQHKHALATDTLLGILAHSSLSIGMVALSFIENEDHHGEHHEHVDLHEYLFGDILLANQTDLYWIVAGGTIIIGLVIKNWQSLTLMTINEDLAKAEGVKTFFQRSLFMFLMTIVVAISIQAMGVLLITSMLIIPAATARQLTRSPESMAIISVIFGIIAMTLGIIISDQYQMPSGPTIVSICAGIFAILLPISGILKKFRN